MQMGFNNDVEHLGMTLHIQTEDHGMVARKVTSQVFFAGVILEARTLPYAATVEAATSPAEQEEQVRKQMRTMHKAFFNRIQQGTYDSKLGLPSAQPEGAQQGEQESADTGSDDPV